MVAPRRLALLCLSLLLVTGPDRNPQPRVRRPLPRASSLVGALCGEARASPEPVSTAAADSPTPADADDTVARRLRGRPGYLRSGSLAVLGVAQWYVVSGADAFGEFIGSERPSRFPYFASIAYLWRISSHVLDATWRTSPWSRQLTLAVVGSSWTIGTLFQGIYENVVGRLTELTVPHRPWRPATVEDRYIQAFARDYASFLHSRRWYDYPFAEKLSGFWALHGPVDWSLLRRVDRRFAFTVELSGKAACAWLVRTLSGFLRDSEDPVIEAWVRRSPSARDPGIVARETLDRRSELLFLPRYDALTAVVASLARQGVRFVQIAGNEEIPLTVIAPSGWVDTRYRGLVLVEWPILTQPGKKRVAIAVRVDRLDRVIDSLEAEGVRLDRVYGF